MTGPVQVLTKVRPGHTQHSRAALSLTRALLEKRVVWPEVAPDA